jgi:hypothetical protein
MNYNSTASIANRVQQLNQIAYQLQQLSSEIQQMLNQLPVSQVGSLGSGIAATTGSYTGQQSFQPSYQPSFPTPVIQTGAHNVTGTSNYMTRN